MAQTLKEFLDEKLKANSLKVPDRNPLVAPQADLAKKVKALLNKYETKKLGKIDSPWNKYATGASIGDLLFGQSPELLDDMSYGKNPLTSGGRTGRLPIPDERLLDMPVPIPTTGGLGVIKNKGGNWLTGSVENALKGLKYSNPNVPDLKDAYEYAIVNMNRRLQSTDPHILNEAQGFKTNADYYLQKSSLNQWIDGPLANYIKNSMATPEDPIRLRADRLAKTAEDRLYAAKDKAFKKYPEGGIRLENDIRRAQERYDDDMSGILHYQPHRQQSWMDMNSTVNDRSYAGFPPNGMGETVLGKSWEDVSDFDILPKNVRSFSKGKELKENPWLAKLDPNSKVYKLNDGSANDLGLQHLIDEIDNALNPTSDLPNNLRLTPEDLANPRRNSMESMVDMVAKVNQHRRRMAIEAEKKSNEAIRDYPDWNVVKEYPNGYRMVRLPDPADSEEAFKIGKACGEKGGWCTKDALLTYGSGDSRVNLLLDPDGKPVAQIETIRGPDRRAPDRFENWLGPEKYEQIVREFDNSMSNDFPDFLESHPKYTEWLNSKAGTRINQIKGKYNQKPKDEHIPYIQDFVKSGNWSDVSDLDMVGLYKKSDLTPEEQLSVDSDYLTLDEISKLRVGKDWKPLDTAADW